MRLRRLDLTRYGRFTNHSIDFGPHDPGTPDLHLVYGPNEAGKSTALSAWLDLLFGIPKQSHYNFLHSYDTMRIGAVLDTPAGPREFTRIKRDQRALLDTAGQPLPETAILGELGGLDRKSYQAMFSLDDDTLEEGGEGILASRGDLGQLLFSASTGLAELSRSLGTLRQEADTFYRFKARSGELHDLKADLARLRQEREGIDTLAADHARLTQQRDIAAQEYEAALAERATLQSRRDAVQRSLTALPRLAGLRAARAALLPLAALPDAPQAWHDAIPALRDAETRLHAEARALDDEIARRTAELDSVATDPAACALAGRLELLKQRHARHITASLDIPLRQRECAESDARIAAILARIGRAGDPAPAGLLIATQPRAALDALIQSRPRIEAEAAAALREHAAALQQLTEAQSTLHEAGAAPDTAALATALAATRDSDHAPRLRTTERAIATQRALLAARLRALLPWTGSPEALAGLAVPDAGHLAAWKTTLADEQAAIARQAAELDRLDGEIARMHAERNAIATATGAITAGEAAAIRGAREAAWALHRARLDAASADAFDAALRRDDHTIQAQLGRAKDVARLHEAETSLARLGAERDMARQRLAQATTRHDAIQHRLAAALRALAGGLPETTSAGHLETWLAARGAALDTMAALHQAERDAAEAAADGRAACARLAAALATAGARQDAEDFPALLAAAQSALDRAARTETLRNAVAECERGLRQRAHALQTATEQDRRWTVAWAEATAATWLGATTAPLAARDILAALGELAAALETRDTLATRIAGMRADQRDFAQDIAALAQALGIDPGTSSADDLAQHLTERVTAALSARNAHQAATAARDEAVARRHAVTRALATHTARVGEMTAHFAVASLAEVDAALAAIARRRDLAEREAEAERDILASLRVPGISEAETLLDAADAATLEQQFADLALRLDEQERLTRQKFADHAAAASRLAGIGADADAARLDERRRTILVDIEDRALRYLRLRAGIVATEHALRAYRDRHRGAMMARASDAFRTISRGAYAGLATRPERDGEVLIAVGATTGAKLAAELSKGTRFQLYLALRVAGYHEFAAAARPVPFIADDIMETFDDDRSEEAFRLLAGMAGTGQVIYLTHHRHLCAIAQRHFPATRIHTLA